MDPFLYTLISVVAFCLCCHQLMRVALKPIPLLASERAYVRPAMQIGKVYKVLAWALMTGVFLIGTFLSFYQIFQDL